MNVQGGQKVAEQPDSPPRGTESSCASLDTKRRAGPTMRASRWMLLFLLALIVFFSISSPGHFATAFNLKLILTSAAILLIISVGQTMVMITGGIDLSVGSVLVFSGVIASKVLAATSSTPLLASALCALVAGLAAGILFGLLNGWLVSIGIPALIVTLGTLSVAMGISQIITGGFDIGNVPQELSAGIGYGSALGVVPWLVIIAACVTVAIGLLMHFTRYGSRVYAVGSNGETARRVGIRTSRYLLSVYVFSGLLSGLAGYLSLVRFSSTTISGHASDNLMAIAAVVLGGTSILGGLGTITGTVVGVLIPVVLQDGFVILGLEPYWQTVAIGAILIVAVYFDLSRQRITLGQRGRR